MKKGVPSLLHNHLTPSPYQCRFLSIEHQFTSLFSPVRVWYSLFQINHEFPRKASYFPQWNFLIVLQFSCLRSVYSCTSSMSSYNLSLLSIPPRIYILPTTLGSWTFFCHKQPPRFKLPNWRGTIVLLGEKFSWPHPSLYAFFKAVIIVPTTGSHPH